jgi:hypothetical protein
MVANQRDDAARRNHDEGDPADSLKERAAIAARAELRGERTGILGATALEPFASLVCRRCCNFSTRAIRSLRLAPRKATRSPATPSPAIWPTSAL